MAERIGDESVSKVCRLIQIPVNTAKIDAYLRAPE